MKIRVYNVAHGERISLHLPLIIGDIDGKQNDGVIDVWNTNRGEKIPTSWPVVEGSFKILVQLTLGENNLKLRHEDEILSITIVFTFPNFKNFVRPLYIILDGDDGYFQGPVDEDCSVTSALERIKLGAMLIQTFTAEKMKEHGFGRQSFQLEVDAKLEPMCRVFHSKLTVEEAHSMSGNDLWAHFARELMTSPEFVDKDVCKWYCFMSFTRYEPPTGETPKTHSDILKHTRGHTALGGGGLALFGTGNLHTWAASLQEVYKRFTDMRKIDRTKLMDDSAYRRYYWANYATGLGASLHELGHTFDLAHTPSGIMARGFDDLHKVFIVQRSKISMNGEHRHSNHERSPSDSSSVGADDIAGHMTQGQGHSPTNGYKILDLASSKRYKDVCYGSPFRKIQSRRNSSNMYIAPPPMVFRVETGFQPVSSQQTVNVTVKNYDGSQTVQTIRKEGSYETDTRVTLNELGQVTGITSKRERHHSAGSTSSTTSLSQDSRSPTRIVPSRLPNSPTETELAGLQGFQYADDGAHWYRASAVLLRFHRWFNKFKVPESRKHMSMSGTRIRSHYGLRLVELRSDPEGEVFHHWEFLSETPPAEFTLKLSHVKNMPPDAKVFSLLAEDNIGNVMKKKVELSNFER